MADHLQIDTAVLTDTGRQLASVAREFRTANAHAGAAAAATGHIALAAVVANFGCAWDRTRGAMVREIDALGQACLQISETFDELDRELGNRLRTAG